MGAEACKKCGILGRHPKCPLCTKKTHWSGFVVNKGTDDEDIERGAPHRELRAPVDTLAIAFMMPYFADHDLIPKERIHQITERILRGNYPELLVSEIWSFKYAKVPYRMKVVRADLTGEVDPFIKARMGGWDCPKHKRAVHGDIPAAVLDRDEFRCVFCGAKEGLLVDYMIPPKDKGRARLSNLITSCLKCRGWRDGMPYWEYLAKLGVPMNEFVIDFKTGFVRSMVSGRKADF